MNTTTEKPAADLRTPKLVKEFAQLKVWFAVNITVEADQRTVEAHGKRHRLCQVVDELRARGVLDDY
jgi:hypothetical protein